MQISLSEKKTTEFFKDASELGKVLLGDYRNAQMARQGIRCGDMNLDAMLNECYSARNDHSSAEEKLLKAKYPAWTDMPVSIVGFKVGLLVAMIRESVVDISHAPFIIDPTPSPELPEEERSLIIDKATQQIKTMVAENIIAQQEQAKALLNASDEALTEISRNMRIPPHIIIEEIRKIKNSIRKTEAQKSDIEAQKLQRILYDKIVEGGFKKAMIEFADDFATYPFACMHAPFPTYEEANYWENGELKSKEQLTWKFERISPFDFFWSSDSTTTQDGTAVYIRKQVSYDYLFKCLEQAKRGAEGYQLEELERAVEQLKSGTFIRNWLDFLGGNPEKQSDIVYWQRGYSAEIIIRYGKLLGSELIDHKIADAEENKTYETICILCNGYVVYCALNKNVGKYKRPVFTASFESRNNSIVGCGLAQRLLPLHKAHRACTRLMLYNLGLSAEPITEVEVGRILQYMPEDWIDNPVISPGLVIPSDSDRIGNGSRAVKFTEIPNVAGTMLQVSQYIFDLAHVVSNIPASLHGQPVGTGANRTIRGLLTLQGNVLKPIHSALVNLDLGVIEPIAQMLYISLATYDNDFKYSGDCKITAKGASTMIQREMDKQTAMENIQILGQLGQQVNPELLNRAVIKLLTISGIATDEDELFATQPAPQEAMTAVTQQQNAQQQAMQQAIQQQQGLSPLPEIPQEQPNTLQEQQMQEVNT